LIIFDILIINFKSWPHIKQEYSLNLSILIREGKENNNDIFSNGE